MCKYCKEEKPIISKIINEAIDDFGSLREYETEFIVFIRGDQLCIGDKDDCNCIDATEHNTIKNCPICGEEVKPYSDADYELAQSMGLDLDDWNDYIGFYHSGEDEEYV